ncbi:hypothetical protein OM076_34730 [Solirubrobacter ginsenosidimutans]|uniref:Uncharacterized protein n=1 Tax=Solirubrobacter ginsenosidimutans TaxID=490573 RepID=A0A9X3MZP2_9ACTN|nr:hypothetical protein [Solirubrobacter ginsenosidimutans]MDA0165477.1 hypothetical protein [Solirubrobacter ginsenosidimutans]
MVTRRALLGAGALALLAGCGPPEEAKVDPAAVLDEQLRVTQAVASAYAGGAERRNAEARVKLVEDALRDAGGTPGAAPAAGATGATAALAAESAALRAHVAAVGELGGDDHRELLSGLIVEAAAAESRLLAELGRPPLPTAFPGQPV